MYVCVCVCATFATCCFPPQSSSIHTHAYLLCIFNSFFPSSNSILLATLLFAANLSMYWHSRHCYFLSLHFLFMRLFVLYYYWLPPSNSCSSPLYPTATSAVCNFMLPIFINFVPFFRTYVTHSSQ